MAYFSIDETTKGSANINKIRRKKEKHVWSAQIMDELLKRASMYECDDKGSKPLQNWGEHQDQTNPYSFNEGDNALDDIIEKQHSYTTQGETTQQKNRRIIGFWNKILKFEFSSRGCLWALTCIVTPI